MVNSVKVPQLAWHGVCDLELPFPEKWQVQVCRMAGCDRPPLSRSQIEVAVRHPIGMRPIREAARGKKEVAILFDDMSRVTRVFDIVPSVLSELAQAGITDSQIRFIAALGCHGTMSRSDFTKKLGEDIVNRFPVYNHNVFGNYIYAGTTSTGIKLEINSEFMRCDYKIGIGSIVPHGFAGYGGGAKIVLPGVASLETAGAMHRLGQSGSGKDVTFTGMGAITGNPIRQTVEEAADLVGLNLIIDAIVNERGETAAVYAGAPGPTYAAALPDAAAHYYTPQAQDCDIVITNTFAKVNEGEGGIITGFPSIKETGSDLVLISNTPEGHVTHYLLGSWGSISGNAFRLQVKLPPNIKHLIVFNEYPDRTVGDYFLPREKVLLVSSWAAVIRLLRESNPETAHVAVYPNSEIQYCRLDNTGGQLRGRIQRH